MGLRRHVCGQLLGQRRQHPVDLLGERPVVRVEEHRLLLDAHRELVTAGPVGPVPAHAATPGPPLAADALDQRAEQRGVLGSRCERLRVPLHAQHERPRRRLDALDHTVGRPGHGPQPASEAVDRLVVERVHPALAPAHQAGEQAARGDLDGVRDTVARGALAVLQRGAGPVGQVLVQRPAARDVQRLEPAADGEDRDPARIGAPRDLQLEEVQLGLHRAELRVAALVVGARVEIGATGQADAGQAVEQGLDRLD